MTFHPSDDDLSSYWRDIKQAGQLKRAHNRVTSAQILSDRGVEFITRNDGAHLIIKSDPCDIDFWPGTGKWIDRSGTRGYGVYNLLRHLGGLA